VVARLAPEFRGAQFGFAGTSFRRARLTAAVFYLAAFSPGHASDLRPIDGPAKPAFSLLDLVGNEVSLDAFRGRLVFVHFFATWCEPCREEIPALQRLAERAKPGAAVVAVSVADNDQRLQKFFAQTPVSFPVVQDRDRAIAKSWDVSALPTTYVLGTDQKPLFVVETDFPWDTIKVDATAQRLIRNDQLGPGANPSDNLNQRRGP
jgi:thiol-disulfide isomerase/thioredoxin